MGFSYTDYFKQLQLKDYDVIVLFSDISKLIFQERKKGVQFDVNLFLKSIKDWILPHQTLLIPTFNWGFCNGVPFDYKKTPSSVGAMGNFALKDSDFKRSKHPIYSFAIYGKDRDKLCEIDNKSAFGIDSIFSYISNSNSCQVGIDINIFTIAHFIEETEFIDKMEHRYLKSFNYDYIDEFGNTQKKDYIMLVRNLDKDVVIDVNPLREYVVKNNITKIIKINEIEFFFTKTSDLLEVIRKDLRETGGKLYCSYIGQKGLV